MSALKVGGTVTLEGLDGRWNVWSQADEGPGAYFLVPLDRVAMATDIKYAVIRATQKRGEAFPELTLIRTEHRSNNT